MVPIFIGAVRTSIVLLCLGVLAACNDNPIKVPHADAPKLESVNLYGQRICGSFNASASTFTFSCDPLPTSVGTGWQLTPLERPLPNNPNYTRYNRGVVFTVSTPSLTSIEVAYRVGNQVRYVLSQVAPGPGRPNMLLNEPNGEVEVAATDDGVRKTWTIAARTNTCKDKVELEVVNISNGTRSNAMPIHFLRAAGETECMPYYSSSGGGPTVGTFETSGPGTPITPPPSACPGGGSKQMFDLCEACTTAARTTLTYTGIESCSLDDAKASMGYGPNGVRLGQGCKVSTTTSEAACENTPPP